MTMLLGPVACGKTKLVETVAVAKRAAGAPVVLISGRGSDLTSASGLGNAIQQARPRSLVERLFGFAKFFGGGVKLNINVQPILSAEVTPAAAQVVVTELQGLLDVLSSAADPAAGAYPVLIIDEANKLMELEGSSPRALSAVLIRLVQVSREQKQSHVILATSDSSFVEWLAQRELVYGWGAGGAPHCSAAPRHAPPCAASGAYGVGSPSPRARPAWAIVVHTQV
jgi:hypothetical protein